MPIKLEEFEDEEVKRYDCTLVKQAFFEKVLAIPDSNKVYRFVAWADRLEEEYSRAAIRAIWNPATEPDREYNLVLSLASNGKHYPLIDWDGPTKPVKADNLGIVSDEGPIWFRSGSGNWHGYVNHFPGSFDTAALMAEQPYADDGAPNKYAEHVKRKGYAGLRPPWLPKGGRPGRLRELYPDALPEGFLDGVDITPPEPEVSPWEEMFND